MAKQLVIGCAHGMGGTGKGDPDRPWLNSSTTAHYRSYLEYIRYDSKLIDEESLYKGYLWKACIDAGIELLNGGRIDDFRVLCTRGTMGAGTEKWLNSNIRKYTEERWKEPFVVAVGKSFGGFDVVRAVTGLRNKKKYKPIDTDIMVLIDPDESLDWGNDAKKVIPKNVKRVMTFLQNQRTGPIADFPRSLRGHKMEPKKGNDITGFENITIPENTIFPEDAEFWPGEVLNHWTIDEYLPIVGYANKWTLKKLIVDGFLGELPPTLQE